MRAIAATLLGAGVIAVASSSNAKRAIGVTITPYVTDAHRKAMEVLSRPLLGVSPDGEARWQANFRWGEVTNKMIALRGFRVVGSRARTLWTAGDAVTLLERFLEAARAGVADGGTYRVTNLSIPLLGERANDAVLAKLLDGERPSDIPLTDLGAAVLEAVQLRNRMSALPQTLTIADTFLVEVDAVGRRLGIEMDAVGYLESGKPPPEPTIGGGLAAAGHAVGGFVAGVAGDAIGGVATVLVSSSLFWAAGLALVLWRFTS